MVRYRSLIPSGEVSYTHEEYREPRRRGIRLHIMGRTIKLRGRNLNADVRPAIRLYEGVVHHRVPWLRECEERASANLRDSETVIEQITW